MWVITKRFDARSCEAIIVPCSNVSVLSYEIPLSVWNPHQSSENINRWALLSTSASSFSWFHRDSLFGWVAPLSAAVYKQTHTPQGLSCCPYFWFCFWFGSRCCWKHQCPLCLSLFNFLHKPTSSFQAKWRYFIKSFNSWDACYSVTEPQRWSFSSDFLNHTPLRCAPTSQRWNTAHVVRGLIQWPRLKSHLRPFAACHPLLSLHW